MSYFMYETKKIFYQITGNGEPVLFLHGNAVSSKLFEPLLPLYQEHFKVILIDFLGHGQSDRIGKFPADLWFSEARQTVALLEFLGLGKVSLAGTSGGAWVAVNAALERPELVDKVVADSFDGRTLSEDFSENLLKERSEAKKDPWSRQFYQWCLGEDWETAVDFDTQALLECAHRKLPLFLKPLEELNVPVLLMGSLEDSMCRKDLKEEYAQMSRQIPDNKIHIFPTGGHPAIATNAELAAKIICDFIEE